MAKFGRVVVGLGFGLAMMASASAQTVWTPAEIAKVRDTAPNCREHPQNPWRGRVSGNGLGIRDQLVVLSFVGCFPSEAECERWKTRTGGAISGQIVQYSCAPR